MATYIDNIVKFHTFSKSPVSKDTTLGGAVNPSGHTVTTSQVRAQDIPAFLNTFQGTKEQAITWLGTNYPTPAHNDIVFYGGEFKAGFSTPKCLKWNAKIETPAWEDFDITAATTLKNADDEDVIAVHQNLETVFVDGSNNAATNSNRNSLFVKRADGSILDHFVASTDKIVAGMPSLGYNALVLWNGGAIDEGELDANYIGNTFAGIVHLNKQYSTGDDAKFKVTCFEYIGEKLNTSITELAKKVESVTATAGEGVQAVTDTATTAGLSVSTKEITVEGQTDPVTVKALDIDVAEVSAQGVITSGDEAKLVTATGAQNIAKKEASAAITDAVADGSVIDTRIDEVITAATLADGEKIATTTDTTKLVTVEDVTTYVSENAKVTLTQGTGITVTPNGEASTAFTIAVDNTVATAQSVTDLAGRVSDTEDAIESLTTGDNSVASQIANATLNATSTGGDKVTVTLGGTVSAPTLSVVESDIASAQTLNEVKNTADTAVQSASGDTYVSAEKEADTTNIKVTTNIDAITAAVDDALVVEGTAVATAIAAAASASTALGSTTISSNDTDTGIKVELSGTVAAPTVDVTVTAATLGTDNKSFTTETSSNFAKASDVVTVATTIAAEKVASIETTETAEIAANAESTSTKLATEASVAKTAQTLTTAIDAIAGVGVSYEVLGDNEKHESVTAPVKGRIYLEKDETAADGTYIEWFYTGTAWEKIGSTKADHSGYARTITINGVTKTVSNNAVDLGKAVTSVTAGDGITSGTVSESGALSLILDEADTNKKGIVQLASTHEAADTDKAATGATVAAAISALDATDIGDGAVKVSQTNGIVSSVSVTTETLVDNNAIKTSVADTNALITANDALAAIKLAKPENYVSSVTVGSVTTSGETALTINDGRTTVYPNDLWGTTVSMVGNTITVQSDPIDGTAWGPKNGYNTMGYVYVDGTYYQQSNNPITKVENNMVYNGTTEVANIKTNEIVNGESMFSYTSLASFSGDLSNLVNGSYMFYGSSLTSFSGDLSSLTDGYYMFRDTLLTSFSGDLSNLVNGSYMFYGSSLTSFSGDLTSLVDGSYMFYENTSLISFSDDLSSLVNGHQMFYNAHLLSFDSDLTSLVNGSGMFSGTSLDSFNGDLSSLVNGYGMFYEAHLDSFKGDLSSLVNGNEMFKYTSLASFSGDLSSLVTGSDMFYKTSLTSFDGDLSTLVNGESMFMDSSLASFSGDLSSLANGYQMFLGTSLTSFSGDLSTLVNGSDMFLGTSLTSFSGDLSTLVNGSGMFYETPLASFNGDLSSLVNGTNMFFGTSLDVESVELICDVLPNYNTENGGKKLQTANWKSSEGKYTYSDWTSGTYYYPIIRINPDSSIDGIVRSFGTDFINEYDVKTITIDWSDISVLSEADRTAITKLFTDTATEKGWTFITNTELGGTVSPNAVMTTDGTVQYYIFAKKNEATEDNATYIDASGKLWTFDTAEAIIGPNIKYWSMFATVEDALTEWGLTPWTKPTEEETEA